MSKNKICLISDIHFGAGGNSEIFLNSMKRFFEVQLVSYLTKNKIKNIAILGDIFENRNATNNKIMDELYNLFSKTLKKFNIYILVGNHDTYFKTTNEVHGLKFIDLLPNVRVVDEIEEVIIGDNNVLFCPWVVDYNDDEVKQKLNKSDCDILFGHFDIVGCQMNGGKISDVGLGFNDFTNFKKVFSGHYHTPGVKKIADTEIVYIGAPYDMPKDDRYITKGFTILDLDTLEYELIPNEVSTKYVLLTYPEEPTKELVEGNIVKVDVSIRKKDMLDDIVDKYISKIDKLHPADKVITNITIVNDEIEVHEMEYTEMTSIPMMLESYIQNSNMERSDIVLTRLNELYNKVS